MLSPANHMGKHPSQWHVNISGGGGAENSEKKGVGKASVDESCGTHFIAILLLPYARMPIQVRVLRLLPRISSLLISTLPVHSPTFFPIPLPIFSWDGGRAMGHDDPSDGA